MRPFAQGANYSMEISKSSSQSVLDKAAAFLSGLCLLHCLAVPASLLLGPLLGHWLESTETEVHWILLGLALPISVIALQRGYKRHHKVTTLWLGYGGLAIMLIGAAHVFGESWEMPLTVIGVIGLLVAHVRNLIGEHSHS